MGGGRGRGVGGGGGGFSKTGILRRTYLPLAAYLVRRLLFSGVSNTITFLSVRIHIYCSKRVTYSFTLSLIYALAALVARLPEIKCRLTDVHVVGSNPGRDACNLTEGSCVKGAM